MVVVSLIRLSYGRVDETVYIHWATSRVSAVCPNCSRPSAWAGHCVIVIEHELDVTANADYLVNVGAVAGLLPAGRRSGSLRRSGARPDSFLPAHLREAVT